MTTKEKEMKSFKDLDVAELRRSAIEDFAVDIEPDASKKDVIAAFVETGIEWKDYVAQHPEVAPAEEVNREPEATRAGAVVTSGDVTGRVEEYAEPEEAPVVRVAEPAIKQTDDPYLIKMVRDNTLYETRGYRFTQEHPYALVSSADAEFILSKEDGFRQAFPSELEEFYG
jgi:hypothetical protein